MESDYFFFQAEDGIRDIGVTGVQTCALPISIDRALESYNLKLSTGQLNRLFEGFIRKVAPPSLSGAPWKLYYVTQVSTAPPTFMLFANRLLPRNSHYRRYLENRLRDELDLAGVLVRLV